MTYSTEQIAAIVEGRRRDRHRITETMRALTDVVNGDVIIPLPEMDEAERPAIANLILNALEQTSTRISSVIPRVDCPPLSNNVRAQKKSDIRRKAHLAWWDENRIELMMAQRARWLVGYGAAPAIMRPNFDKGIPRWDIRNPLTAFPSPGVDPYELTPANCAFVHKHPFGWLKAKFPAQALVLAGGRSDVDPAERFEILEWFDAEELVLIGLTNPVNWFQRNTSYPAFIELLRTPIRMDGMCPVVYPGRITLDRPGGQFDQMVGMYHAQAKLMALNMIAVERAVFPDTYLVSQPGATAALVGGYHEGRTGEVNIVQGGDVKEVQTPVNPAVFAVLDRLERSERLTASIPAEYGGESATNIRTGRRGEQVLEGAVSFPIAEAQTLLARGLAEENRRATTIALNYFRNTSKTFALPGLRGAVTYLPSRDFETNVNTVVYPMAGTDVNNLTIMAAQMNGAGLLSKLSAMKVHPIVGDAEAEHDQIVAEALEAAQLAALQQMAASGAIPPADLARITKLVTTDAANLFDAIEKVHQEAQERQASAGPVGAPEGPVPEGAPQAQPGLALPGTGAEAPTAGPPPSLASFLATLGGA